MNHARRNIRHTIYSSFWSIVWFCNLWRIRGSMSLRRLFCLSCVSLLSLSSAIGANSKSQKSSPETPPALETIIFDQKAFVGRLAKKVLVSSRQPRLRGASSPEDPAALQRALNTLTEARGIEFIQLPATATAPQVRSQAPPTYPPELIRDGKTGKASFLVMLTDKGLLSGIYCTETTLEAFATYAAAAVVRWQFTPAQIAKQNVPVLTLITISFAISQD
jgi:hypothetical protein